MKALVLTSTRNLKLTDVDKPEIGNDDVLLRVKFAGICGSDLHGYAHYTSNVPYFPGHEFSGIVEAVGNSVKAFHPGDTVVVNPLVPCGSCIKCKSGHPQRCRERQVLGGGFAEYATVPASNCYHVSDLKAGALVEPLACGIRAAKLANIQLGETVAVFGAGIIGLFCMKAAQLMGATTTVLIDTNERRLEVGRQWSATHLYHSNGGDVVQDILKLAGGPIDVVLDAVGAETTRQQGVELVDFGGRITWIGRHQDQTTFSADTVVYKEIQVSGTFCYAPQDFTDALMLIEQGIIKPEPGWLSVRPLEEGANCFEEQVSGHGRYAKIMYGM